MTFFAVASFINPHDIMYMIPGQDRGLGEGGFPTLGKAPDTPLYNTSYVDPPPPSYTQMVDEDGRPNAHLVFAEVTSTLLGQIPIVEAICESGDSGHPIVLDAGSPVSKAFSQLAESVIRETGKRNISGPPTRRVEIKKG